MYITLTEGLMNALFCFAMVCSLLCCLYILVKVFTNFIRMFEISVKKQ